jgi:hypothetical protein
MRDRPSFSVAYQARRTTLTRSGRQASQQIGSSAQYRDIGHAHPKYTAHQLWSGAGMVQKWPFLGNTDMTE